MKNFMILFTAIFLTGVLIIYAATALTFIEYKEAQKELVKAETALKIKQQELAIWQTEEAKKMVEVEKLMERYYSKFRK